VPEIIDTVTECLVSLRVGQHPQRLARLLLTVIDVPLALQHLPILGAEMLQADFVNVLPVGIQQRAINRL
jgi:hypothetical protein